MGTWTGLVWLRVMDNWRAFVDSAINLQVPLKCEEFIDWLRNVSFSRRILLRGITRTDVE